MIDFQVSFNTKYMIRWVTYSFELLNCQNTIIMLILCAHCVWDYNDILHVYMYIPISPPSYIPHKSNTCTCMYRFVKLTSLEETYLDMLVKIEIDIRKIKIHFWFRRNTFLCICKFLSLLEFSKTESIYTCIV